MQTLTPTDLGSRYAELREQQPRLRIRNAARDLGVSEVELVALGAGDTAIRLEPSFKELLSGLEGLGHVMALTRNDDVVHERKGIYRNAQLEQGPVGLFVGADIDLRIFWQAWDSAWSVREGDRLSLQFFAHDGSAIHKVYLTDRSDMAAYEALVARFRSADQSPAQPVRPASPPPPPTPDEAVDVAAFRAGWLALEDTHDFHMLVGRHRLARTQALRLAPEGDHAVPVAPAAFRAVLTAAAAQAVPIMVFVGNRGMLQIHTGPVVNVVDARGWLNVLDPEFNLHVQENSLAEAWVVRKPTRDGVVTALECYNSNGEQLVQLFGKRKPGIPELETWRELIHVVEQAHRS